MNKLFYNVLISPVVIMVTIPVGTVCVVVQILSEWIGALSGELIDVLPKFRKY